MTDKPLPSFIEKLQSCGDYDYWSFGGKRVAVSSLHWHRSGEGPDAVVAYLARKHFVEKRRDAEYAVQQIDQWLKDRAKPEGSSFVEADRNGGTEQA